MGLLLFSSEKEYYAPGKKVDRMSIFGHIYLHGNIA